MRFRCCVHWHRAHVSARSRLAATGACPCQGCGLASKSKEGGTPLPGKRRGRVRQPDGGLSALNHGEHIDLSHSRVAGFACRRLGGGLTKLPRGSHRPRFPLAGSHTRPDPTGRRPQTAPWHGLPTEDLELSRPGMSSVRRAGGWPDQARICADGGRLAAPAQARPSP